MIVNLPLYVKKIIACIEKSGFSAYAVGGCVRDSLLGIVPNDWDITTNALPEDIISCFPDRRIILTGLKHGTVTVVFDGNPVEITTFRIDGKYSDNRRPDHVAFTDKLDLDLERRDFTVNAMAYNEKTGLIDLFKGHEDLKNKVIRCVGEPEKRFNEDALRILRALRFAAVFGFDLDKDTKQAVFKLKELLINISAERKAEELKKLLCGMNAGRILYDYKEVFAVFLPKIAESFNCSQDNPHHDKNVWEHICCAVGASKNDLTVRLALLFHDTGKPFCKTVDDKGIGHFKGHAKISSEIAFEALKELKFSNKITDDVCLLVSQHENLRQCTEKSIKRIMKKTGEELFGKLLEVNKGDILAQSDYMRDEKLKLLADKKMLFNKIAQENQCFSISGLDIDGNDLISMGIPQGKIIGKLLNKLLSLVIDGEIENKREALLEYIKNNNILK